MNNKQQQQHPQQQQLEQKETLQQDGAKSRNSNRGVSTAPDRSESVAALSLLELNQSELSSSQLLLLLSHKNNNSRPAVICFTLIPYF